jgi:hypothetical protein
MSENPGPEGPRLWVIPGRGLFIDICLRECRKRRSSSPAAEVTGHFSEVLRPDHDYTEARDSLELALKIKGNRGTDSETLMTDNN